MGWGGVGCGCCIREVPLLLQSHAVGEAHWDGRCLLSVEEQQAYFLRNVVRMDEDDELVMAMEDLATTTQ